MLIRTAILFPILSIALAAPTLALAESEMHFSRGEVGYTFYPNHVKSTKTTAQVMQELQEAKADGSYQQSLENYPAPAKSVPSSTKIRLSDCLCAIHGSNWHYRRLAEGSGRATVSNSSFC
jgi:hypothetical protein